MEGDIRVVTRAKRDEIEADNMDACWPARDQKVNGPVLRLAMADGATEHLLSGGWANDLVRTVARAPMRTVGSQRRFARDIGVCSAGWVRSLAGYADERREDGEPLHWYEVSKLWDGAAATLLAVFFSDDDASGVSGTWRAAAVGDTNFFQVRPDEKRTIAFPLQSRSEFSDTPPLLLSLQSEENEISPKIRCMEGNWESGEHFYLATDALAAWICGRLEAGVAPWLELNRATNDPEHFSAWLEGKRARKEIHNDDVTLLHLEIH